MLQHKLTKENPTNWGDCLRGRNAGLVAMKFCDVLGLIGDQKKYFLRWIELSTAKRKRNENQN